MKALRWFHFEHQKGMVQATDFTHHSNLFKAKLSFILGGSLSWVRSGG
jgi:hypothetical protein